MKIVSGYKFLIDDTLFVYALNFDVLKLFRCTLVW